MKCRSIADIVGVVVGQGLILQQIRRRQVAVDFDIRGEVSRHGQESGGGINSV